MTGNTQDVQDGHVEKAMRFALNSLAARAQSVAEIRAKLAARGVPVDVAAAVVDEASRLGYLDDAELAGQLARGHRARGYGRRRAERELRRRGVHEAEATAALVEAYDDVDEVALARAALGSRATTGAQAERRAVAFLVRRGFSAAASWAVVRQRRDEGP
jgi:regulatory protein